MKDGAYGLQSPLGIPRRCDFCDSPEIRYAYPMDDFDFGQFHTRRDRMFIPGESWAACEPCSALIEKNRWDKLLRRAIGIARRSQPFAPESAWERITESLRELQHAFQEHRAGTRRKLRQPKAQPENIPVGPRADWSRATEAQAENYAWWSSREGVTVLRGWLESFTTKNGFDWGTDFGLRAMATALYIILRNGDTFYVSRDMTQMVEGAALTIPDQPLLATDPISRSGFVFFDRSLSAIDARGKRVAFRAAAWHPARFKDGQFGLDHKPENADEQEEGIALWYFSDHRDTEAPDDYRDDPELARATKEIGMRWSLLHFGPWKWSEGLAAGDSDFRRYIAALWAIANQPTMTARHREQPNRPMRRRWERQFEQAPVPPLTVVTLRREYQPTHESDDTQEHAKREYSHRFPVSAHWRRHPYQPGKFIPIPEYVKGPSDKPLVVKKRVFRVVR